MLTRRGSYAFFWIGQSVVGHGEYNAEQRQHGEPAIEYRAYLRSTHFWEATTENWESEFLQIFSYVFLTAFLFQKAPPSRRSWTSPSLWTAIPGPARGAPMPPGRYAVGA